MGLPVTAQCACILGHNSKSCNTCRHEATYSSRLLHAHVTQLEGTMTGTAVHEVGRKRLSQEVRRQLAPWEQQISQVQSRLGVATSERDMLQKTQADAKQRLQVK